MSPPAFTFRLERVRALRERSEDLAREELAASLSLRVQGEGMLRSAEYRLEEARELKRGHRGAPLTGEDLRAAQAYLEQTERMREAAALDLERREADVEAHRGALEAAARERQVLERLKDRRHAEHKVEAARVESGLLDEMATTRFRRAGADS